MMLSSSKTNINTYNSILANIKDFYKYLNNANFKEINLKKLIELKTKAKTLNNFYNYEEENYGKGDRYAKVMDKIKTRPGMSKEEKYLLFMLSVDPDFEAFKIYSECNKTEEIKTKMIYKFGVFDQYLVIIEKFYIKRFLSEKKRNEINEEIEKRIFK